MYEMEVVAPSLILCLRSFWETFFPNKKEALTDSFASGEPASLERVENFFKRAGWRFCAKFQPQPAIADFSQNNSGGFMSYDKYV